MTGHHVWALIAAMFDAHRQPLFVLVKHLMAYI